MYREHSAFQTSTSQLPTNFHDRLLGVLLDYNVSHDCRHSILQVNAGLQNKADWAIRSKYMTVDTLYSVRRF